MTLLPREHIQFFSLDSCAHHYLLVNNVSYMYNNFSSEEPKASNCFTVVFHSTKCKWHLSYIQNLYQAETVLDQIVE